jgi:predicted site-specific integrase-resolvase
MLTATQAAKQIGCSTATISRWASRLGYVERHGGSLVLSQSQVRRIAKEWKKKAGNPNFGKKK